jgi:hypothetical protein
MEVQIRCLIEIEAHARCTRQSAPTAAKSVKCRSNQTPPDQFTVESVGLREDQREGHATRFTKRLNSSSEIF